VISFKPYTSLVVIALVVLCLARMTTSAYWFGVCEVRRQGQPARHLDLPNIAFMGSHQSHGVHDALHIT